MLIFKYSSILFFEKFSNSLKLGFYIQNINLVIRNFSCNIVIIIPTFRTGTEKLVFICIIFICDIFIVFKPSAKNGENI